MPTFSNRPSAPVRESVETPCRPPTTPIEVAERRPEQRLRDASPAVRCLGCDLLDPPLLRVVHREQRADELADRDERILRVDDVRVQRAVPVGLTIADERDRPVTLPQPLRGEHLARPTADASGWLLGWCSTF